MCEQVEKKILFSQCRYIDPGDQSKARSADWHYSEVPHFIYVELCQYEGGQFYIIETWKHVNGDGSHNRELLSNSTNSYQALRMAITYFDELAKVIDSIAMEISSERSGAK